MKKAWKKLLATMLAGVMALSCVVTAGATEPSKTDGVGGVDPEETGVVVPATPKSQTKYAGGNATGSSRTEGKLPVDPVRIELPTINAKTLDMIIDPFGLINRTGAARYESADVAVEFQKDTPLYFLNSIGDNPAAEDDEDAPGTLYKFTDETQALTVTNKSHVPVGLDVTLRVNKNDSVFKFVDSKDALEAETEGAAMFLALKSGEDIYDVKDLTATAADEDEDEEEEEDEETAGFVATP
ncbi:MAG: hypothetical protein IJQ25_10180, partial [Oscillibacter sp.]|nr:hypothetical protein [Oscillibacter sp.]